MQLSVVSTIYKSEEHIHEFIQRISAVAGKLPDYELEIILVNDGSPDKSLDIALAYRETDARVKIIDLTRNFGHHPAILAGLERASGEIVFLIDSDLEEEPENLLSFHETFLESGADVVFGVQQKRKGHFVEQATGSLFWWLLKVISGLPLPKNIFTSRLMSRKYVQSLLEYKEADVFLAGLWHLTGYKQVELVLNKGFRGKSSYKFTDRLRLFVTAVTSLSTKPLYFTLGSGLLIFAIGAILLTAEIIKALLENSAPSGWASLLASVWLLGGLNTSMLGMLGIYLAKVFTEVKDRPRAAVRDQYGFTS